MTTTATSTYLAGMTKSGSKIHRVAIVDGATYTGCGSANSALYSRGRQGRIVSTEVVEIDEIPTGALCGSCFPGIISKPRIAAPVAPSAPKAASPAPVAAEMISYEEAFDMIKAAGHADKVGGRAWILPGQVDRNAILDTIAGWNA